MYPALPLSVIHRQITGLYSTVSEFSTLTRSDYCVHRMKYFTGRVRRTKRKSNTSSNTSSLKNSTLDQADPGSAASDAHESLVSILQCFTKALAKQTRKSTHVNASLQNQNLHTDLRRVAKRIRKSARKSQKAISFTHIIDECVFITTDYLRSTCVDLRWVAKR